MTLVFFFLVVSALSVHLFAAGETLLEAVEPNSSLVVWTERVEKWTLWGDHPPLMQLLLASRPHFYLGLP